ncbi:MAG: ATP-binding protein [Candidatus Kapaibacteriota bacterium]|jgi:signal transduction histidine kinase
MDEKYQQFTLFNAIPIGICIINNNFEIVFWNKQLEIWTNILAKDIFNKKLTDVFPNLNNSKYIVPITSVLNGGPPVVFSTQLHKSFFPSFLPDMQPRLLHTTVSHWKCVLNGEIFGIISVEDYTYLSYRIKEHKRMRDEALKEVEMRKKVEEELRQSEQKLRELNATKDKFFSIIAHDLKNPIGAFKNVLELLYENFNDFTKEEILEFIEPLKESSTQLFSLLENLLLWSRAQTGRIQIEPIEFDIVDLIRQNINLLQLQAANKQIKIEMDVPERIFVLADINSITTVLRNLISNAIKFTQPNGKIVVSATSKNNFAEVCVEDTGVGMSKETMEKLFRIDVHHTSLGTANEKGTGLGLIVCKEFVEANGGQIWVESKEGKGSKFYFTIPLAQIN